MRIAERRRRSLERIEDHRYKGFINPKVPAGCLSDTELRDQFILSFNLNYPGLCEGRRVIVVHCIAYKHDPETEGKELRGHKGSHHETLRWIIAADNYQEINAPLEHVCFDGKNLVINVCKVGRHRAVANKEMQLPTLASILYDNDNARIGSVDLQSLTDWKHLCSESCTHCKINPLAPRLEEQNSKDHLECMSKSYKLLSAIIPFSQTEVHEHEQEESEEEAEPSQAELKVREWVADYGNKCTRKVLKALNSVYEPRNKISKAVGKIEDALVDIVLKHDLGQATVESLFVAHDNRKPERCQPPKETSPPKVERVKKEAEGSQSDDPDEKEQHEFCLADDPPSDQDCVIGNKKNGSVLPAKRRIKTGEVQQEVTTATAHSSQMTR